MQKVGVINFTKETSITDCNPQAYSYDIIKQLQDKLPNDSFSLEDIRKRYPPLYVNSMNTVLIQELMRFNVLLQTVQTSLWKMLSALRGEELMSSEIEETFNSVLIGRVPEQWLNKSYPSLKSLIGYIADLRVRFAFFKDWVEVGPPVVYWIAGFFFPQSFLTGVLQNYARKEKIPIDTLSFSFTFFDEDPIDYSKEIMQRDKYALKVVEDGVYIAGLHLEGCRWDYTTKTLAESLPKVLFSKAPIILFKSTKESKENKEYYNCPIYKTTERKGILDSTGHSTNYIIDVRMPTRENPEHWVKRGVAMICQLNE